MVAHNPKALTLAPNTRFTENTKTMPLGEGLWKEASGLQSYRQDFLDLREGQAASHMIVEANGNPIMLALRLKIADKKIAEIETMVTRNKTDGAIFAPENLKQPQAAMNVIPAAAQKLSRAELIRIAEFYPLGLKAGGSFDAVKAPFAPDIRIEKGRGMAWRGKIFPLDQVKEDIIRKNPQLSF
jgi:hypothetical protein